MDRIAAWGETSLRLFASHPLTAGLCAGLAAVLVGLFIAALARGRSRSAFWCVAALIAAWQILPPGYDGQDHAHRIVALADQIRRGAPSLLIEDRATGSVLPIFVYYSILPYLPSLLLNLAGLPAFVALKLVAAVAVLVMAAGVRTLIDSLPPERQRNGYLAGTLFLSANYVYGLWIMRVALAEIWVFALVPWIVVALLRSRRLLLFGLLLAQLCSHPVVFGHALGAELLVALAIALPDWRRLACSGLPALLAALIVSAPFWLPQMLWKDFILGTSGLPVRFADTFFTVAELVRPLHPQTLGLWLPIAVALMLALCGRRLPIRVWLIAAAFVAIIAIQTRPLFALADAIPLLSQSLLVWRLMFPTALIGFAALALGWPAVRGWPSHLLPGLTLLSCATMIVVMIIDVPGSVHFWSSGAVDDDVARRQYVGTVHGWAVREYAPNYARLASACDIPPTELQAVEATQLRGAVRATAAYLSIRDAPFGTVAYLAGDKELVPRACRDRLILGPLPPGAEIRMSAARLGVLLALRLIVIVVMCTVLASAMMTPRCPKTVQ